MERRRASYNSSTVFMYALVLPRHFGGCEPGQVKGGREDSPTCSESSLTPRQGGRSQPGQGGRRGRELPLLTSEISRLRASFYRTEIERIKLGAKVP